MSTEEGLAMLDRAAAEAMADFDRFAAELIAGFRRNAEADLAWQWWLAFAGRCVPDGDAQFLLSCKIMEAAATCVVARENL